MTDIHTVNLTRLFDQVRSDMTGLCLALEQLADTLHEDGVRQRCLLLARSITPMTMRCHRLEEDLLFPAILEISEATASVQETIEVLRRDHLEDECFAEELQDALLGFGSGSTTLSADAMGYMLRGFFLAERRHLAFEDQVVRPLIEERTSLLNR